MIKIFIGILISVFMFSASAETKDMMKAIDPIADWKAIESVIANGSISPDWRDARGYSAAYYQLNYGSERRAEELILRARRKGVWVEGKRDRLLDIAIRLGSQRVVAALIKHGEQVSATDSGGAPVQLAAALGRFEIFRMLVRAGADPRCIPCHGQSPIEAALQNGHWQIVLLMRNLGVDFDTYKKERNQGELVFRAIDGKSLAGLIALTKLGFDFNLENAEGKSPLEYAIATQASDEIIEDLVMRLDSFCRRNSRGQSLLDVVTSLQDSPAPPSEYWLNVIRVQASKCD